MAILVATVAFLIAGSFGDRAAAAARWSQQQKLTASDASYGATFGSTVSVSADGNSAVVGALYDNANSLGAAYVMSRSGGVWTQQQKLTANDPSTGDAFGNSVSLSADGTTALIGASSKSFGPLGVNSGVGAAYVFTRGGGAWSLQQELTASDGTIGDNFGTAVALSGDGSTAIVTALGKNSQSGAAYVFTRVGTMWSPQQELSQGPVGLGNSVALSTDGGTALVGAANQSYSSTLFSTGAAYVYSRSSTTWSEQQMLTASDPAIDAVFGVSVALSGDGVSALVGASGNNGNVGASYVFSRSGASWTQQQELTATGGIAGDLFGFGGALSGDGGTAVIGAMSASGGPGAAYVFTRGGGAWSEQQKLTAADAANGDQFGFSVSVNGDGSTAMVGAPEKNLQTGAAYVFTTAPTPPPPQPADLSLALTSTTHVVADAATTGPQVTTTVTNNGPGDATGVTLTEQIDGGGIFATPGAGCALDTTATHLACAAATLASGASVAFTATALHPDALSTGRTKKHPDAGPRPPMGVAAAVVSTSLDPDLSNNTATLIGGIAVGPRASAAGRPMAPEVAARLEAAFLEVKFFHQIQLIAALPQPQRRAAIKRLLASPDVTSQIQADALALVLQGLVVQPPNQSAQTAQQELAKRIEQQLRALVTDIAMV